MELQSVQIHEDSRFRRVHFTLSQVPGTVMLLLIIIITSSSLSDKFVWAFFCLPCLIPYFMLVRKFGWDKLEWQREHRRIFLSMIGVFFFIPIFIFSYVIVWDPTLSIQWYKSNSCTIAGQFSTKLGNLEHYSLQYVNLNSDTLGISCISDKKTSSNLMKGYDFYKNGEIYSCEQDYLEQQMIEQTDEGSEEVKKEGASNTRNLQKNPASVKYQRRCRVPYRFSSAKIPSWLCSTYEENNRMIQQDSGKDLVTERTCYFAYYGGREEARWNGKYSKHLKDEDNFIIVRMDEEIYYNEVCFLVLIVFGLYPAIIFSFQAPSSCFIYSAIEFFYQEEIAEENKSFSGGAKENQSNEPKNGEETSATERKKQRLQMNDIVQALSPNSKMNDRDFYDIYRETRRRTARNQPEQSMSIDQDLKTEVVANLTYMATNQTKSLFLDPKNGEKSFKDLEDLQQRRLNASTIADEDDEQSVDQDSSYIKIRKIYKRKLNPSYQKEQKIKKKGGIPLDNEENMIIKEMKQVASLGKQPETGKDIIQVDIQEINQQNPEQQNNNPSQPSQSVEKVVEEEEPTKQLETVEKKEETENKKEEVDPDVRALEEAYGKYAQDVIESEQKRIDSQPADDKLLE